MEIEFTLEQLETFLSENPDMFVRSHGGHTLLDHRDMIRKFHNMRPKDSINKYVREAMFSALTQLGFTFKHLRLGGSTTKRWWRPLPPVAPTVAAAATPAAEEEADADV